MQSNSYMKLVDEVQLEHQAASAAAWSDHLAVGTYQLDEQTGLRQGCLLLFQLQQCPDGSISARQTQAVSCAGVFEATWDPSCPAGLLGAALADGSLAWWTLQLSDTGGSSLVHKTCSQVFDEAALATNLAVKPAEASDRQVAVTSSAGEVALLDQVC